jgi:hypothetical protein
LPAGSAATPAWIRSVGGDKVRTMNMNGLKALSLGIAGVLFLPAALGCNHDDGQARSAASSEGAPAAKGPVVYDRTGKATECTPNKATPANPANCPPEAPDMPFIKACEGAHFKTVVCGDCWTACTGKVSP